MFGKRSEPKKRGSFLPFVIVRLFLSLIIFSVFGLGIYQAFKNFSGLDPLKIDPKTLIFTALTSEQSENLLTQVLGVSFSQNFKLLTQNIKNSLTGRPANAPDPASFTNKALLIKFAMVADSHSDNTNLKKALDKTAELGASFVIGLGDYTNVGTKDELISAKEVFDRSRLPYYLTVGDHDLWDSRNRGLNPLQNYSEVFGPPYQSFAIENLRFLIVYDSDNQGGIDSIQWKWLEGELAKASVEKPKATFILTHEPLYHPSSDHFLGKENPAVLSQAQSLINLLKQSGVNEVFAGDTHFYTRYIEPKTQLKMTTIGALSSERNAQTPRFSIVDVYQDGSYNVQDLEVK